MSTLSTANIQSKAANTPPVIKDLNGTECGQFCRAWVSFNGTTDTISDSFNVAAITDVNPGIKTVTFTTAMSNSNYVVVACSDFDQAYAGDIIADTRTTTTFRLKNYYGSAHAGTDTTLMMAAVFGG